MANKYRDVYCGEVTKEYVGKEIRLAGWIENVRNLGSLVFITLRDEKGVVQLISNDVEKICKNAFSFSRVEEVTLPKSDIVLENNIFES